METSQIREDDRRILQALSIDPRASFRDLGRVVGASDHTITRRYRAMQAELGLRVTGRVVEDRLGWERWVVRIKTDPGAVTPFAQALAVRPDTRWVRTASGGTEIVCGVQTRAAEQDALAPLVSQLPAPRRSYSLEAHLILAEFSPTTPVWLSGSLSPDEAASLSTPADSSPVAELATANWTPTDETLLRELQRDGRATAAHLALATGWHESTVRRRIAQLTKAGALAFDLDLDEHALGLPVTAQLWLTVDLSTLDAVGRQAARHVEAPFVAAISGTANLFISAACQDTAHLYRYLIDTIGPVPGIRHIDTVPISHTHKRTATTRERATSMTTR